LPMKRKSGFLLVIEGQIAAPIRGQLIAK
jgi:hypothetical protein